MLQINLLFPGFFHKKWIFCLPLLSWLSPHPLMERFLRNLKASRYRNNYTVLQLSFRDGNHRHYMYIVIPCFFSFLYVFGEFWTNILQENNKKDYDYNKEVNDLRAGVFTREDWEIRRHNSKHNSTFKRGHSEFSDMVSFQIFVLWIFHPIYFVNWKCRQHWKRRKNFLVLKPLRRLKEICLRWQSPLNLMNGNYLLRYTGNIYLVILL